jgi:hypothetical protein
MFRGRSSTRNKYVLLRNRSIITTTAWPDFCGIKKARMRQSLGKRHPDV